MKYYIDKALIISGILALSKTMLRSPTTLLRSAILWYSLQIKLHLMEYNYDDLKASARIMCNFIEGDSTRHLMPSKSFIWRQHGIHLLKTDSFYKEREVNLFVYLPCL